MELIYQKLIVNKYKIYVTEINSRNTCMIRLRDLSRKNVIR